jgi:hypothetical protein
MLKRHPLAAGVILVLVVVVGSVAIFRMNGSSSAQTVSLPNVTGSDFEGAHITATAASPNDEHPKTSSEQARGVATSGDNSVSVLAVNLINLKVEGRIPEPRLVWAVSLDPATAPLPPVLGDYGLNDTSTPAQRIRKFAVVFVDASDGTFLFGWSETAGANQITLTR